MQSIFSNFPTPTPRPPLTQSITADVAVIGGGMAGILIARRLAEKGASVVVLEAERVGSGQTAGTTAKLTPQHGTCYRAIIHRHGEKAAREYAAANMQALSDIRAMVQNEGIDCDFADTDSYIFSLTDRAGMLREYNAQQAAGLPVTFTTDTELPVRVAGAVKCAGTAEFHPQKFLHAVAAPLTVFEHTPVRRVLKNTVITEKGRVTARHIVFATHYPFVNVPGFYFTRLHQERSYVLALRDTTPISGMYKEIGDSSISLRRHGEFLLLGGSGHRTGEDAGDHYADLRATAASWLPSAKEAAHWSAQDVITPDNMPYIGQFSRFRPDWYIATGFGKWGMTTSMVAANLLTAQISGHTLPSMRLFSPTRFGWRDLPAVLNESGHAVKGLTRPFFSPADVGKIPPPGEAAIMRLHGRRVGIYHDTDGKLYAVHARCTHLGCALTWNPDEKTWDCPCHGSRFDKTGAKLNGPAQESIAILESSAGNSSID